MVTAIAHTGTSDPAGIGGGASNTGGSITITGGTVVANGIGHALYGGLTPTFIRGNVFIHNTGRFNPNDEKNWSGMIIHEKTGKLYGDRITLNTDAEIPAGVTLTIEAGKTLTIGAGTTLVNRGTITIAPANKLGTAQVQNQAAELELTLFGEVWNRGWSIGSNQIIADYGGSADLLDSIGSCNLTVEKRALTAEMITAVPAQTYSGNAITPTPQVRFSVGGNTNTLAACTSSHTHDGASCNGDFYYSNQNNLSAGTATVTINATKSGNYSGAASKDFTINRLELTKAKLAVSGSYTGAPQVPAASELSLVDGNKVYAVEHASISASNNVNAGQATVTVTFLETANYAGTFSCFFTIAQQSITPVLSVTGVSKVFDGAITVTGSTPTSFTFPEAIVGEMPVSTADYAYQDANVGVDKTIDATNIMLSDADVNKNYQLSTQSATAVGASITAAEQTVTNAISYGEGLFTYGDGRYALAVPPVFAHTFTTQGSIQYESSDPSVLTVNADSGEITLLKVGAGHRHRHEHGGKRSGQDQRGAHHGARGRARAQRLGIFGNLRQDLLAEHPTPQRVKQRGLCGAAAYASREAGCHQDR